MYGVSTDYLLKGDRIDRGPDPFEGLGLKGRQLGRLLLKVLRDFGL